MSAPTRSHRLYILRHAHSSWALPGQRDHHRPLDARGRRQADRLARFIAGKGYRLDVVVCSTAKRASETYDRIRPGLDPGHREESSDALYALGVEAYYDAVRRQGDTEAVLLVGHNPMIEAFTLSLIAHGDPAAIDVIRMGFPTCGLAVVEFSGPLSAIAAGTGRLCEFVDPDDLG
ncbi:MAG TPA: histidine phosphatase family protein [Aurantimonas sp.]